MLAPEIIGRTLSITHSPESCAWYAVYTRARHEKRVAGQLAERSVECFLPMYRSARRWNDRSRLVELPLLPGYLFIRIALRDRLLALQIPSVVRMLEFHGQPVAVPEAEVQQIRDALHSSLRMEPHPYLRTGSRARVTRGPLEGTEGYIVRHKSTFRVVISLHLLLRSVAVELDAADLQPLPGPFNPQPSAGVMTTPWAWS